MEQELSRRAALKTVGGAGLAAVFGSRMLANLDEEAAAATTACVLTRESTEGPYWVPTALTRRDVREGRPGTPLIVRFTVLDARTCKPIRGADVEIWHADALGAYSAVDGASSRFLRGHQRANASGKAEFLTVFPGWYPGRTPHIHLKVNIGGNAAHTGQVFFDERTTRTVYRQAPYASRGVYDTSHAADGIFAQAGGAKAQLTLVKRTGGKRGYVGTLAIGVLS